MYKEQGEIKRQTGSRCKICTGCGLCPGVSPSQAGMHVVTENLLNIQKTCLQGLEGCALIIADIGTTTIAMELYGADGKIRDRYMTVNPQTKYGADVLSRITAAEDPGKAKELMECVRNALIRGIRRFFRGMKEKEIPVMLIAANTVMTYLLMGWDPKELGHAPFTASHLGGAQGELLVTGFDRTGAVITKEEAVDPSCSFSVPFIVLPGISAFVGGDILAGIDACEMLQHKEMTLFIDLGTNGEIVLGNRDGLIACSTAAGPAFEGGANKGIWGADMIRLTAELLKEGLLDETGLLSQPYDQTGIMVGGVLMTGRSIRQLQLAKAAIYTGITQLTEKMGINLQEIDRVVLGGGFGYFLNPADAVRIGLLPAELEKKALAGGNTALAGSYSILSKSIAARLTGDKNATSSNAMLSHDNTKAWNMELLREYTEEIKNRTMVLNLAMQETFGEEYIHAMNFEALL